MRVKGGVTDGIRTRDIQGHNLTLCQLSYGHQPESESSGWSDEINRESQKVGRPTLSSLLTPAGAGRLQPPGLLH